MSTSNFATEPELSALRYRVALIEARVRRLEGVTTVEAPPIATPPIATPPIATPPIATPPIATPPIATPPIATPPIATPPIATPPIATPPIATPPIATPPIATPPIATRSQAPSPSQDSPKHTATDWENIIGGRLSLWIGALCLFLAIASLLAITWKTLPPPPPIARVLFGFAASFGLLIGGHRLKTLSQRWFSEGLMGTGLAVGYLSAWAAGPYYDLWPSEINLFGLAFWAFLGGALAVRNDSRPLLILSAIGGFLTPVLLSGDTIVKSQTPFLLYVLVLNAGIVAVTTYKSWRETFYLSYGATVFLLFMWSLSVNFEPIRWTVWIFFSLYFGLFLAGQLYDSFTKRQPFTDNRIAFIFSHTFLYAFTSWLVLRPDNGFFILGLAAFCAGMWKICVSRVPLDQRLSTTFATLGLIFFVAFVPLQFNANFTTIGWFTQSLGLAIVARRFNSSLLRKSEIIVWFLGVLGLLFFFSEKSLAAYGSSTTTLTDTIALTSIFALGITSFLAYWTKKHDEHDQLLSVYVSFVVWGVALLMLREVAVLPISKLAVIGEFKFYLGTALCLMWSVMVFKFGIQQRIKSIEVNGWFVLGLSLGTILVDAASSLHKALPLINAREGAFLVGFAAIAIAYQTLRNAENGEDNADARTLISITGFLWLMTGATIEISNYFAQHSVGISPRMFVLCALWAGFGLTGFFASMKMREAHLKSLALVVLSGATGVLLWNSVIPATAYSPFLNPRVAAFGMMWLCIYFPLRALHQEQVQDGIDVWQPWKLTMSTALMVLPLWVITQEALNSARTLQATNSTTLFVLCAVWAGFGCAGFYTAQRLGENHLKVLALFTLSSSAVVLLCYSLVNVPVWTPLLNIRLAAFAIIWLCVWATRELIRSHEKLEESDLWQWCELTLSSALLLLPLWATTQEVWNGAEAYKDAMGTNYSRYASLLISLFWSIYGALTLYSGVIRQDQNLRIAGLALGALTICKVYLLDLSFLDGGLRVLSLAGLGISLLFISWLYGRLARQEINTIFPKTP